MEIELVQTKTSDDIVLSGAYFGAKQSTQNLKVDMIIFFHGDGGNFYGNLLLELGELFSSHGVSFLAANRRGHDMIARGAPNGPLKGYAFESVSESSMDYEAWLGFVREKNHKRIVLAGHSGGAVRATYAQATVHFPDVVGVVSVSPGEYNHKKVIETHGDKFITTYREAEQAIKCGNSGELFRPGIPWGSIWSAEAFVDCFNQDNRYSVSAHAGNTQVPTLYVFGGSEVEIGGPEELPVCGLAMRTIRGLAYPHVDVRVVSGANHGYVNCGKDLMQQINAFIDGL